MEMKTASEIPESARRKVLDYNRDLISQFDESVHLASVYAQLLSECRGLGVWQRLLLAGRILFP